MKKFFFCVPLTTTGNISNGGQSGKLDTQAQAEAWAAEQLGNKSNYASVIITESIAVCERQASPVKVTKIFDSSIVGTEASVGPDFTSDNTRQAAE